MLSQDSEDEMWSRFMFELLIWLQEATLARWTQSSGPLCLWQCFKYNAFCKWLLTQTMNGSTRCRFEGEINLNLNYICGWGKQQLFNKDGLSIMLVTKKLVLSEVSTKVAARPIKKKLQLLFRDLLLPLSALNSLAGLVSGRTAFQNLAQLKPQFGSNTSHIDLSPNCL